MSGSGTALDLGTPLLGDLDLDLRLLGDRLELRMRCLSGDGGRGVGEFLSLLRGVPGEDSLLSPFLGGKGRSETPGGASGLVAAASACGSTKFGDPYGGEGVPSIPYVGDSTADAGPLPTASLLNAASWPPPPPPGRTMSGRVGFTSDLIISSALILAAAPVLLLNSFTFSLTFLQGIRSSGELSGSPQAGQALVLFSESVSAVLAHSSHTEHAHMGIMMQSLKRSLHTGHLRSSGI